MSTLTKIFIVLLVVLSLVLAAATVTFVTTIGNQRAAADAALQEQKNQTAQANRAREAADAARAAAETARQAAVQQIETLSQQTRQVAQVINDRDVKNAELQNRLAIAAADITRLTDSVKALQDQNSKQADQIAQMNQARDQALTQAAQMSMSISELTNKLEVTERERRFLAEQLEQQRQDNTRLGGILKDNGIDPSTAVAAGMRGGAPKINGVIRDVRTIANVPYATISVGSADGVVKGMEFKIVDRNTGNFLGLLTVDTAEPNEAVGRISGPRVAEVHPGVEVRTQL